MLIIEKGEDRYSYKSLGVEPTKRERAIAASVVGSVLLFFGMAGLGLLSTHSPVPYADHVSVFVFRAIGFVTLLFATGCFSTKFAETLRTSSRGERVEDVVETLLLGGIVYGAVAFFGIVSLSGHLYLFINSFFEFLSSGFGI